MERVILRFAVLQVSLGLLLLSSLAEELAAQSKDPRPAAAVAPKPRQSSAPYPDNVAGNPELWLRADAGTTLNGSALTQWSDQSGNNHNATQSSSGSQPTLVNSALNALPVVRFDGFNDFLTFTLPINGLTGMTIFLVSANTQNQSVGSSQAERAALFWNETAAWGVVYLSPFQSSVALRFGTSQSANRILYTRPASIGNAFTITTAIKNGATDSLQINGAQVVTQGGKLTTIANCQSTGNIGRGYNDNTYFAGDIAEVLVYARTLTAAEQQAVGQYLNAKYGLAAPVVPDIRISPLTINYEAPASLAQAQTVGVDGGLHQIRLKNRLFVPAEGDAIAVPAGASATGLHTLVQFNEPVTADLLAKLRQQGVTPLQWVPRNTVLAYWPATARMMPGLRWVGPPLPTDKLSQLRGASLAQGFVLVDFYPDVTKERALAVLTVAGAQPVERQGLSQSSYLVRATEEIVQGLALHDEVSWVWPASAAVLGGEPLRFCPGPLTSLSAVPAYVAHDNGWDGPGLGSANLTYHFMNGTPDLPGTSEENEVARALNEWSRYAAITWTPTATPGLTRSIDILWASGDHGDGSPFDGVANVLAHCFYPAPPNPETIAGDLHLDEDEAWHIGSNFDLFSVALHEAGHGLGLAHSDNPNAIMYPFYRGVVSGLNQDDIDGIRAIYAANVANSFMIFNDGNADLNVTSISAETPAPWISWSPPAPFTIAPGGSRTVALTVNLMQAPPGLSTSRLLIFSNDPDESPYPAGEFVNVTSNNTAPEISVSVDGNNVTDGQATPIDFGSVSQGQNTSTRTFTVRNDGNQTLTLGAPNLPTGFTLSEGLAANLAPAASDTFTVQLDNAVLGTKTGEITFSNNDSNENPFNIPLTGQVLPASSLPAGGLALWLRADAGTMVTGSALTQWSDQSGNNRHATQATGANQPMLLSPVLNGLPVVRFDGANDFLTFNLQVNGLTGMTIFLVAANTASQTVGPSQAESAALFWNETASWGAVYLTPFQSSVAMRFGTTQTGNRILYARPSSVGSAFTITTSIKNGTTDSLYVNGTQVANQGGKLSPIAGCQSTGNLGRGYNDNTYFAGTIAELVIYSRALTSGEQQSVEQYLNAKYFSAIPTPPQITTQPANLTVNEPAAASFTVQATGTAPLAYQWRRGALPIAGATSASFALNTTSRTADTGAQFDVIVSNAYGSVTSVVATLTVNSNSLPPSAGLALWLRADAGTVLSSGALTQWSDQSGNSRHATQTTGPSQPLLVNAAINGLPVVRFDGVNDFLTFNLPVNGLSAITIFLVAANTQNQTVGPSQGERAALFWNETAPWGTLYLSPFQSSVAMRFGTTQAGNRILYGRPSSLGSTFTLTTSVKDGTTDSLYVNGALVVSQTGKLPTIGGCQDTGNLARGYNDSTYYAGDIAEVLFYNRALLVNERQSVDQYLGAKYGLTVGPQQAPHLSLQVHNGLNHEAHLVLAAPSQGTFNLERSSDLIHWVLVETITVPHADTIWSEDIPMSDGVQFFRVREQ